MRKPAKRKGVKPSTIVRNRKYLNWLREFPCVVSNCAPPSEPCHTFKSTGGGGIGLKSSDKFALPLSHEEHQKQSRMSEVEYWRNVLVSRPRLRDKMTLPGWMGDITTDDILVKRMVQAYAEMYYYNAFLKGETP